MKNIKTLITVLMITPFSVFAVDPTSAAGAAPQTDPDPGAIARFISTAMYETGLSQAEEDDTRRLTNEARNNALRQAAETSNRIIGGALRAGRGECFADPIESIGVPKALQGARLLMATIYQNCEAPTIELTNDIIPFNNPVEKLRRGGRTLRTTSRIQDYANFNPYLSGRSSVREGCFDVMAQPPIYGYGAKPSISNGVINLHQNQAASPQCRTSGVSCNSQPVTAIDCSGFVTGALRRMGLNLNTNEQANPSMINTSGLNRNSGNPNSCLQYVQADRNNSIQPGDILNVGANHVIMVDEVGDDPLGIERHAREGTCNRIGVRDFDIKFLHSGALEHVGVAKVSSSHPEIEGFLENFVVMAQTTCNHVRNNRVVPIAESSTERGISILRHVGEEKPGCVGEPERFQNEECVEGCGLIQS